jgi:hypothetical protein
MTMMVAFLAVRPICPHLLYHTISLFVQVFLLFTRFVYLFWSNLRHLIPIWRVWQQSQYPFDAWRNMKHIGFAMALQGQRAIHLDSTGQFGRDFWPRRVELGVGIQCDFHDSFSDQTTEKKHRGMVTSQAVIPVNLNLCLEGWSWIRSPVFRGAASHLFDVIFSLECPWVHTEPMTA